MQSSLSSNPSPATPSILNRLNELNMSLATELKLMPAAQTVWLQFANIAEDERPAHTCEQLLAEVQRYWSAPGAQGTPRSEMFVSGLEQTLRDAVALGIQEHRLHAEYAACLPSVTALDEQHTAPRVCTLSVQLNEHTTAEIHGALVMTLDEAHTLLWIPGFGVEGFASPTAMREAITQWINDKALRTVLLSNALLSHQDVLFDIETQSDLFLEMPFNATHWQLTPIADKPFGHSLERQLHKQREDIAYAFGEGRQRIEDQGQWLTQLDQVTSPHYLFGPARMLELRDAERLDREQYKKLPDWLKNINTQDSREYLQRLDDYEQSRIALSSVMGGASSPEQFAISRLRTRIESDLGYDLNPEHLLISTWRKLPLTNEPYKVTRSMIQMALYGLHAGDMETRSDFIAWSTLSLQGQPLGSAYPGLTNRYIAELIESLDLRVAFGAVQREVYGSPVTHRLMGDVTRQQIRFMAFAARLQNHIQPDDFKLIEQLDKSADGISIAGCSVHQMKLNSRSTLSNLLLLRKENEKGQLERLVLFTAGDPRGRSFQGFDSERQLIQELVSWSAIPDMTDYLLQQVAAGSARAALKTQLYNLSQKPQPAPDFITLGTALSYQNGVQKRVLEHIRVALTEQQQHTPGWYLTATPLQRQELVALEDAIRAAHGNYEAKPHAQVQTFDNYVHQRATKKINDLLWNSEGTVDPDRIIITSDRETQSYTQMLRNGYDDSLNPISSGPLNEARFSGPEGIDLRPLTAEKVARSVRGIWVSDEYVAHIKATLLNPHGTGYTYRRRASLLVTQLQMHAAALRSQLKGEITVIQYQWLKTSIERMHEIDLATRQRHPLYPLQFKLSNPLIATNVATVGEVLDLIPQFVPAVGDKLANIETVQGCYLLTAPDTVDAEQTLLYTPNAPDGLEFRLLSSFTQTLKREGMSDYYKDRCRFSAGKNLAFFLADMKNGGKSQPPELPAGPFADLYSACFNQVIERKIRNVEDTTTGRSDMLAKMIWTSIELIATAVTLPFPPASFAVGLMLSLRDSLHALKAFSEGDQEAVSGYLLGSLLNGLGAAGDLQSGLKGMAGVLRQVVRNAGKNTALDTARQLKQVSPPLKDLHPVQLHGEQFWRKKSPGKTRAALYRANAQDAEQLIHTGRFAEKDAMGTWQALRHETSPGFTAPQGKANSALAVDVSLEGGATIITGHAKGVTVIAGQHYIGLEGLTFMVQFDARMRCWMIIDSRNPYAFFGKQPVRLNEQGTWQIVEGFNLKGGSGRAGFKPLKEQPPGSTTAVGDIHDYELPANLHRYMQGIVDPEVARSLAESGLGIEDWLTDLYKDLRKTYITLRENLYRDADIFFRNPVLPARPQLPLLDVAATPDSLLKNALGKTNGLVISEGPKSIASKQWLIESMPLLVEQKVEILYIEHLLTDIHVRKLAKYKAVGKKTRSGSHELKQHFKHSNDGALDNQSEAYDYYHLVKVAHRHGIEVKPLNSSVSYPFNRNPVLTAAGDTASAQKMSNFFGHKVINADTAAMPARRWVALVDEKFANTWEQVPGITELHGAISVRVEDVAAGRRPRVSRDPAIKADFKLEMANPLIIETGGDTVKTFPAAQGFQLDEAGRWQPVDPAAWPAQSPLSPIQLSLVDADYEMPVELRAKLHDMIFEQPGLSRSNPDAEASQANKVLFERRQKVQNDARDISSSYLPPRPTLALIASDTPLTGVLDSLYENTSGVVVGASFSSIAGKKFVIDNMEHLSRQQVKTLYLQHLLTDLHQIDLDRFADTGQMSKTLLRDLQKIDRALGTNSESIYTLENLVIQARVHKVEIRALNCSVNYPISEVATESPFIRHHVLSYFASRTIRRHQAVMGSHKWIALVGDLNTNTYRNIVPGIAELEGGIGVRLVDTRPGQARGFMPDPGEHVRETLEAEQIFIKGDYRLEMDTLPALDAQPGPSGS